MQVWTRYAGTRLRCFVMYETLIRNYYFFFAMRKVQCLSLDLYNRMCMLFGVFTVLTRHIAPFIWLKMWQWGVQGAVEGWGKRRGRESLCYNMLLWWCNVLYHVEPAPLSYGWRTWCGNEECTGEGVEGWGKRRGRESLCYNMLLWWCNVL